MNVEVTPLPGIGVRKDFEVSARRRVGVVSHREGGLDLILSKVDDPDACMASVPLSAEEAATLSNLLGAPQLVEQLRDEHRDLPGLTTRHISVTDTSPFDGREMGDSQIRTRTGSSIVAVLRAGEIYPSPRPAFLVVGGDMLIIAVTAEGIEAAARILQRG
ncbi:MAG: potassium transporter TrkA [Tomitella sp.]|nr:potassium transporter TrkA [Tomitella sp.]